jgi:hypothetical protein
VIMVPVRVIQLVHKRGRKDKMVFTGSPYLLRLSREDAGAGTSSARN